MPLVLAGLAAFAYYRYSKMTKQEKDQLVGNLKDKGKKLYDQYMPKNAKNMINNPEQLSREF